LVSFVALIFSSISILSAIAITDIAVEIKKIVKLKAKKVDTSRQIPKK
jgi:hypothetical protein